MMLAWQPASVTALYMEPAQCSLRGPGADLQGYSLYMALSAIHQQTCLKAELQGYSTTQQLQFATHPQGLQA